MSSSPDSSDRDAHAAAYTNVPSLLRKYADRTTGYIYEDEVAVLRAAADEIERQAAILDDLCDWAQHVAAPEDDAIHSIVERAEAALIGEPDA